jgi:acyl-CoA thioester hydrolase
VSAFHWPVRVYWEDTDAGGVVYYANYLRFLERCRTEWLRSRGISQQQLAVERGIQFMVLRVNVEYRGAARLDDELVVSCQMEPEGRTTATFRQEIRRAAGEGGLGEVLIEALVRVVCVDAKTLRPRRIGEYLQ